MTQERLSTWASHRFAVSCSRQLRISAQALFFPGVYSIWKWNKASSSAHRTCLGLSTLVVMKYSKA
jgi:hypothetical protein